MILHSHINSDISVKAFLHEVLLDGFLDTLKVVAVLFLTYLLMEYIEHKATERTVSFMKKSGSLGPLVAGTLGAVPQCAFSAMAANLYTGRVITVGALFSVFLSTSDEMLPILISSNANVGSILKILAYKVCVGIAVGFAIDIAIRIFSKKNREIDIDRICDEDGCNCEKGIFCSALHHTVIISIIIFAVTLMINTLMFFIGTERLAELGSSAFGLTHLIFAVLGLIPGCGASVAISTLGIHGIISVGTMLSGLFTGSGVGIIILFKQNKNLKENLTIILSLVAIGFGFGMLADFIGLTI
ncbi:MAG: arsenic efflux protein [Clostridia bacterium]|nr:arsenic efflux protein [Clostridia bacterium]